MAYMSQAKKKELAPAIKAVLNKYNVKGSISVRNAMCLVVTLQSGPIDFDDARQVNTYWIEKSFTGQAESFLSELRDAMMTGNHDRSDIMTDYFDVGWYIEILIGKWNKPYICTARELA